MVLLLSAEIIPLLSDFIHHSTLIRFRTNRQQFILLLLRMTSLSDCFVHNQRCGN